MTGPWLCTYNSVAAAGGQLCRYNASRAGVATAAFWMLEASAVPVGCWMTVVFAMGMAPHVHSMWSPLPRYDMFTKRETVEYAGCVRITSNC